MNSSLPPLPRLIEYLRDTLRAPASEWPRAARRLDGLPRVTLNEAGDIASIMSASARNLLRQLPLVSDEAAPALRESLSHLTDALQMELNAKGARLYHIDKG